MRTLQDLNLCDDFLFHEVMMDEEIARKFLETVLDVKIRKIVYSENEKTIKGGYAGKSIRLDVYLEDDANTVYNIEMQNGTSENLPKRSRKYSAQIDMRLLKAGEEYAKLKRQIVIFLCTFDLFGKGYYCYTFSNRCHEIPELELGDETTKIFLNTKGTKGNVSKELKALLKFVENSTPENAEKLDDPFAREMAGKIITIKEDEEIGGTFMTFEEKLEEIAKATAKKVAAEKDREYAEKLNQKDLKHAQKLKEKGMSIEDIADVTGLTAEQIEQL